MKSAFVLFAAMILVLPAATGFAETRPNIIFLFAEDQEADTMGVHENPAIQTPNFDQLATRGFSFRRNDRTFTIGRWHNDSTMLEQAFSSGKSVCRGGKANHATFQVQDLVDGKLNPNRDADRFPSPVYPEETVECIHDAKRELPYSCMLVSQRP